jgi:hypothetical protein
MAGLEQVPRRHGAVRPHDPWTCVTCGAIGGAALALGAAATPHPIAAAVLTLHAGVGPGGLAGHVSDSREALVLGFARLLARVRRRAAPAIRTATTWQHALFESARTSLAVLADQPGAASYYYGDAACGSDVRLLTLRDDHRDETLSLIRRRADAPAAARLAAVDGMLHAAIRAHARRHGGGVDVEAAEREIARLVFQYVPADTS